MSDANLPRQSWPTYARQIIECAVRDTDSTRVAPPQSSDTPHSGVFVTLKKFGRLRGCMGTLDPSQSIANAVQHAARVAALSDPRFPSLTLAELPDITIEVSILSTPQLMKSLDDLVIGTHGIIVRKDSQRGLFLPQVAAEHKLDKETFLSRCCSEKAGLSPDAWKNPDTEVHLFTADITHE